ncbi:hypothetical protein ROHU_006996 [Labeo rohita]|uniref:Uncharacterized protein n=1 Tax=Labeo rohita TaxID=84645 RepID=A0A498MHM0_LABRO|nr:hypothetical protein ROHU_006996 [Labeo rohita]
MWILWKLALLRQWKAGECEVQKRLLRQWALLRQWGKYRKGSCGSRHCCGSRESTKGSHSGENTEKAPVGAGTAVEEFLELAN